MEPTFHSRGSRETLAACNSTRSVPPYFGRLAPRTACVRSNAARRTLITASKSDPVDLIVPRMQIARDDKRAGRILLPIDIQDRAGKFAENRGATLARQANRHDLKHFWCGPVTAVGNQFPSGGIAGWRQHGCAPPYWFCGAAFHFPGRGPTKTANLAGKKHVDIGSLGTQLATRVAGRARIGDDNRNGLFHGASGVELEGGQLCVSIGEKRDASFGAVR